MFKNVQMLPRLARCILLTIVFCTFTSFKLPAPKIVEIFVLTTLFSFAFQAYVLEPMFKTVRGGVVWGYLLVWTLVASFGLLLGLYLLFTFDWQQDKNTFLVDIIRCVSIWVISCSMFVAAACTRIAHKDEKLVSGD